MLQAKSHPVLMLAGLQRQKIQVIWPLLSPPPKKKEMWCLPPEIKSFSAPWGQTKNLAQSRISDRSSVEPLLETAGTKWWTIERCRQIVEFMHKSMPYLLSKDWSAVSPWWRGMEVGGVLDCLCCGGWRVQEQIKGWSYYWCIVESYVVGHVPRHHAPMEHHLHLACQKKKKKKNMSTHSSRHGSI